LEDENKSSKLKVENTVKKLSQKEYKIKCIYMYMLCVQSSCLCC